MEKKPQILLVVPKLNVSGGIANYYNVLKKEFSPNIKYFVRPVVKRIKIAALIISYFKFFFTLIFKNYRLIQLNTSLDKTGILRDVGYIYIAKFLNKKVSVFFRGWHSENESSFKKRYLSIFFKSDFFIVLAEKFKKKLISWGYKKPIYIETTVVDHKYIKTTILPKEKNTSFAQINILFLTRIEKYKGIYEAIDTYKILLKKHKNLKFTFAGDGSELNNIREYAINNNITNIDFTGFLHGINKYLAYSNADIYFHPSYSEGMPNSVLEAMACGLPIVASSVGGLEDFFINGKMGFLTNYNNPDIFATLIDKLILNNELRTSISNFNYNYSMNNFYPEIVVKRLENIFYKSINTK